MSPIRKAGAHLAKRCTKSRKQIQRLLKLKMEPPVEAWTVPPLLA